MMAIDVFCLWMGQGARWCMRVLGGVACGGGHPMAIVGLRVIPNLLTVYAYSNSEDGVVFSCDTICLAF